MSNQSEITKLIKIMSYISDIESIIGRHYGIENALKDKEGQYALMMCMLQIGELSKTIKNEEFINELPIKDAVAFRNRIAHGYEGIQWKIINQTLQESIPDFKNKIITILKKFPDYLVWEKLWQK